MKTKSKRRLLIILFISFFLVFFTLAAFYDKYQTNELLKKNKLRLATIGNIEFRGKVIKTAVVDRFGKPYCVMCIKLDYTNTNDVYIFNDLCALKIKNGVATIPGGIYDVNFICGYIEVNTHNDKKTKYFYKNGQTDEFGLGLSSMALVESDMNLCN